MSNLKLCLPEKTIVADFRKMCEESLNPDLYSCLIDEILPALEHTRSRLGGTSTLLRLTEKQADDESLWFDAKTAPEAHLQQALRELQAAIKTKGCLCTDDCPFKIFKD
jgi:hypothetical protein